VYAILGGLVAQVIALVTMVFQPGLNTPSRIARVNSSLLRLQAQLLTLVLLYGVTLILALATKVAASIDQSPKVEGIGAALLLAFSVFFVVVSLVRSAEMAVAIISVQRLRGALMLEEAEQRVKDQTSGEPEHVTPDRSPEAYGRRIVRLEGSQQESR
jgi:hypothetical protein